MTKQATAGFGARNRWALLLGGLVAAGLVLASASATAQSTALATQKSQIESLEARNSREAQKRTEFSEKTGLEGLGVSASRVKADSATIDRLLSIAFTWDSGETYETARIAFQDRFGLSEKDSFFQAFMPPSRFNRDADGKRYYYIDAVGLNSALGRNTDAEVVAVTGARYRYAVMTDIVMTADGSAKTSQQAPSGPRTTAIRRVLLYVTLDARGTVSELAGIPPSGSTRLSR